MCFPSFYSLCLLILCLCFPFMYLSAFGADFWNLPVLKLSLHLYTAVFVYSLSCVQLFVTPWTVACQAPLSLGFSRQEDWSRLLFAPPGDLPHPGAEPTFPTLAGWFFSTEPPGKSSAMCNSCQFLYFLVLASIWFFKSVWVFLVVS